MPLYKSLVRPQSTGYCVPIWSPHNQKDIELVEKKFNVVQLNWLTVWEIYITKNY